MPTLMHAAQSYRAAASSRSVREQEADVFRRITGLLRASRTAGDLDQTRALADNQQLWTMMRALARDPENRLEAALKAALISISMAVQREMDRKSPDFDFLIAVNENIAAGLAK